VGSPYRRLAALLDVRSVKADDLDVCAPVLDGLRDGPRQLSAVVDDPRDDVEKLLPYRNESRDDVEQLLHYRNESRDDMERSLHYRNESSQRRFERKSFSSGPRAAMEQLLHRREELAAHVEEPLASSSRLLHVVS
jgi:hypothetical protein